jgi:hypothetical protein
LYGKVNWLPKEDAVEDIWVNVVGKLIVVSSISWRKRKKVLRFSSLIEKEFMYKFKGLKPRHTTQPKARFYLVTLVVHGMSF